MKIKLLTRFAFALSLALAAPLAVGCDTEGPSSSEQDVTQKSAYTADMAAYNAIYGTSFADLNAAYSVIVKAGELSLPAPTHLFGEEVNVIPYSNTDGEKIGRAHV